MERPRQEEHQQIREQASITNNMMTVFMSDAAWNGRPGERRVAKMLAEEAALIGYNYKQHALDRICLLNPKRPINCHIHWWCRQVLGRLTSWNLVSFIYMCKFSMWLVIEFSWKRPALVDILYISFSEGVTNFLIPSTTYRKYVLSWWDFSKWTPEYCFLLLEKALLSALHL